MCNYVFKGEVIKKKRVNFIVKEYLKKIGQGLGIDFLGVGHARKHLRATSCTEIHPSLTHTELMEIIVLSWSSKLLPQVDYSWTSFEVALTPQGDCAQI